ncbi:MAG: hypothetical protein KJ052_04670 [Candidatus Hydrogenedentes bacterium]|nr:hypothetical protein [Candidatus Hydrogenedentota bacterium]
MHVQRYVSGSLMLLLAFCSLPSGADENRFDARRHVFIRGEVARLDFVASTDATSIAFNVDGWLSADVPIEEGRAVYEIDTAKLRPGEYVVKALSSMGEAQYPITIAPPYDEERIPVWRWGGGGGNMTWWMERGFTGGFFGSVRDPVGENERAVRLFEEAARNNFELGLYLYTVASEQWKENESVRCLLPDGTVSEHAYPFAPEVVEYSEQATESWMQLLEDLPGLRHVMLNSEYQVPLSVNDIIVEMAIEETGADPRDYFQDKWKLVPMPEYETADGIIADDNPWYRLLQWWWQRGHGTALLNLRQNEKVKQYRPDVITWHEPYRLAPVRYSHTGMDAIATWTYGYPDIKRLCYTTYMQAVAKPESQLVQQDITLFVYGRYAVPVGDPTSDLAQDFAGTDPYFTAGPDYAREAIWLVMSQRPDMLCFYSAGAMSPDNPTLDPFYSSPETFDAIGQTCAELVRPFGPMIRYCTRAKADTAVLMSASSTWFPNSAHLQGYPNEQTLPYATLLMMNHLPFEVVLDDDIVEKALDRYTTLVIPKGDTFLETVHNEIVAFAENGGTVVADASMRAEAPGAQITDFDFAYEKRIDGAALVAGNAVTAEEDREIKEGYAAELAPLLAHVKRPVFADSPRVLTNTLVGGGARYHFLVNDNRTYGPRFGEYKLRFELGVQQSATVHVALDARPVLYDCLQRERIEYAEEDGYAMFETRLPAARGKLIAALPEAVDRVSIEAPEQAVPGETCVASIMVIGESGTPFDSVHPLEVAVIDPLGRTRDYGRYTATQNGVRDFSFTPALNDPKGEWTIRVTDLVAGKQGEVKFSV